MTSGIKIRRSVDADIAYRVDHVKELKEIAAAATARFEEEQAYLIALIGDRGTGNKYKAKVVRKDSVVINEAGLKKALGAAKWKKIVKTVLDRKALDEQMQSGEIDPVIVSANSEVKPQKPYVSFSRVIEEGSDEV